MTNDKKIKVLLDILKEKKAEIINSASTKESKIAEQNLRDKYKGLDNLIPAKEVEKYISIGLQQYLRMYPNSIRIEDEEFNIDSSKFKHWLVCQYYDLTGDTIGKAAIKQLIYTLNIFAESGKQLGEISNNGWRTS